MTAQIVGAALHVADTQRAKQRLKERHVAKEKLILEGLGAGGDDDALARTQGWEQVGQGLAGAGAGLDDEVTALFESPLHGLGHFQLAGTVFIGQRRACQDAAGREELVQAGQGAGCGGSSCGFGGGHRD